MTFACWLRCHPLLGYFALASGIGWGGNLITLGVTDFELIALPRVEDHCARLVAFDEMRL